MKSKDYDGDYGAYITKEASRIAGRADAILFDCDGVMVDVALSYYKAISATVSHVLHNIMPDTAGATKGTTTHKTIDAFKSTGGFNDEVDVACAIILCTAVALKKGRTVNETVTGIIRDASRESESPVTVAAIARHIQTHVMDISRISAYLEHPSARRDGLLYRTFDWFFFGSELYKEIHGDGNSSSSSPHTISTSGPGLIEEDRLLINEETLAVLSSGRFGERMAIITGRGKRSAEYTLGELLAWFDIRNSAFLEDEPLTHAKPNPARLDDCIRGMGGSGPSIYIGDSIEDLIMTQRSCEDLLFCGITGTSSNPQQHHRMLKQAGASMILESASMIPKALNLEL